MNSSDSKKATRQYGNLDPSSYRNTEKKRNARRRPSDRDPEIIRLNNWLQLVFFPAVFLYLELILHIAAEGMPGGTFFVYAVLFGFSAGFAVSVAGSLTGSEKVNYAVSLSILGLSTLCFILQLIYFKFSKTYLSWGAPWTGEAASLFRRSAVPLIFKNFITVLLFTLPFILYAVFGRKTFKVYPMRWSLRIGGIAAAALLFLFGTLFVNAHSGYKEDAYYYKEQFDITEAVSRFGAVTAVRLDTKYSVFGGAGYDGTAEEPVSGS
ncbi:MAG: hypothetical protein J5592_11045 [Clostridia bacterium]|nr:hypothetical protein [Clostridia bacterium]